MGGGWDAFPLHGREVTGGGKTWAEDENLNLDFLVPLWYLNHKPDRQGGKSSFSLMFQKVRHLLWCRKKHLRTNKGFVKRGWHRPPEGFPPAEHFLLPPHAECLLSQKKWAVRVRDHQSHTRSTSSNSGIWTCVSHCVGNYSNHCHFTLWNVWTHPLTSLEMPQN